MTFETVRRLALTLPGVEEGTCYGTPAFRVRGKLLARLREDGESLVVRIGYEERELRLHANPETFYITDHYRDYPSMLVRLSRVRLDDLRDLLESAWRDSAPERLIEAYTKRAASPSQTKPNARRKSRRVP